MIGVSAHPSGTLLDRIIGELAGGPIGAQPICGSILGMPNAPKAVAERLVAALLGADPRVRQLPDGRWGLVPEMQASPLLDECAFAVVDVETTGMRAWGSDRITEIAVVLVHGTRREVVFDTLVNPGRPIPPAITQITRISNEMVRHAPTFAEIAD
ncbi:MAG TPA: exonuclease domain-containing protein, partial [Gemmatimonadales bacterium]